MFTEIMDHQYNLNGSSTNIALNNLLPPALPNASVNNDTVSTTDTINYQITGKDTDTELPSPNLNTISKINDQSTESITVSNNSKNSSSKLI